MTECVWTYVIPLFTCTKVDIRKKTCIFAYKILNNDPKTADKICPLLADRICDEESSVQISSVTSILRLSVLYPDMFLFTIPKLFTLLESKSNWLLIKTVKLLMLLFKVESRLGPKLVQKFSLMLDQSCAKSV